MGVGKYHATAALITGYIIASASGEIVNCQNASLPASGWAESTQIGQSLTACLNLSNYPEQLQNIQRVSIYRRILDDFFQCSKLGKSWHNTTGSILSKRVYELSCPSETKREMCGTVFNGSKDDMGDLHFAINDQTGEQVDICSLTLSFTLKYPPPEKSESSDHKNGEIIMGIGIPSGVILLLVACTVAYYIYKTYNKSTEHAKNAISDNEGTKEETLNLVSKPDQDEISSLDMERQHTLPEQSGQDAKNAISDKEGTKEETLNLVSKPDLDEISSLIDMERQHTLPEQLGQDAKNATFDKAGTKEETSNLVSTPGPEDEISSLGIKGRHTPPEQSRQRQDAVTEQLVYGTDSKLENPPVETYSSENQDSIVETR